MRKLKKTAGKGKRLSRKGLERRLLEQLPLNQAMGAIGGSRLEDLTAIRLWAAEKRMELQREKLPTWPFGIDFGDPLSFIHAKYAGLMKTGSKANGLVCPSCGGKDQGNILNGKPWCMKCNVALVPIGKMKKWMKSIVKVLSKEEALKKSLKKLIEGEEVDSDSAP